MNPMKHIKLFEELRLYSYDDKLKLKDLCESYLSYLIDDGFIIKLIQNSNLRKSIEITITKGIESRPTIRQDFSWLETRDHVIPLVLNLQRKYYIEKVIFMSLDDFTTIHGYDLGLSITEESLDNQHLEKLSYIIICLGEERNGFTLNETFNHNVELQDLCKDYLSYLLDDGFNLSYEYFYGGRVTLIKLYHNYRNNNYGFAFTWDEVKDRYIPFLLYLTKEYKLFNFHWEDKNCERNQTIKVEGGLDVKWKQFYNYYTYSEIISDNGDLEGEIESITIKVGRLGW